VIVRINEINGDFDFLSVNQRYQRQKLVLGLGKTPA
jgi:hypothetical protein